MNYLLTKKQLGSTLVVALILLIALSLLAISSMNTATLDLIMAGNEQYRARAFSAAESGIKNALLSNKFSLVQASTPYESDPKIYLDETNNSLGYYSYTISNESKGGIDPAPSGNSEGLYGAIYYRITATGKSERQSTSTLTQDLYEVVRNPGEISYSKSVCEKTTSLDTAYSTTNCTP